MASLQVAQRVCVDIMTTRPRKTRRVLVHAQMRVRANGFGAPEEARSCKFKPLTECEQHAPNMVRGHNFTTVIVRTWVLGERKKDRKPERGSLLLSSHDKYSITSASVASNSK